MPEFHVEEQFTFNAATNKWLDSLPAFTFGYVEAMFFTEREWLAGFGHEDDHVVSIPVGTRTGVEGDCDAFVAEFPELEGSEDAGANFWYTRNRHGAGFWDGGWGADGDRYTKVAKEFGSANVDYDPVSREVFCD